MPKQSNPQQSPTVCLVSLGCPKNLVDSEKMLAELAEAGFVVGAPMDDADVIVINTCGFLSAARDESLAVIREALDHKRSGRTRRVVVAGCLPTRDGEKLYELAPGIDALVGVNDRGAVLAAVRGKRRLTRLSSPCSVPDDAGRFRLTPRHTAYLRIAEGCSQRCSYCTIPAIRGPLRSKQPEAVLAEARQLIDDGAVELSIIAQDTTAYGQDLGGDASLPALLRRLDELDGATWLRLMYTYPRRFTDELIDVLAAGQRVLPYVDIPLQHINETILRRMGRGVGRAAVEKLLDKLRDRVDGIAIRTTFIVGFPGETDAQFEELLAFVDAFQFDALGVFAYSPEEGTPAAGMDRQVPDEVKAERVERIMLAQQGIAFAANEALAGAAINVLVDGVDERGRCVGRYYGQAPEIDAGCILTDPRPAGRFVDCTIAGYEGYDLVVEPN